MPDLHERLAALSPEKRALLLARLNAQKAEAERGAAEASQSSPSAAASPGSAAAGRTIQPRPRGPASPFRIPGPAGEHAFPVSFSQLREWILDRFSPGTDAYNIPTTLALSGSLVYPALASTLARIVHRHESLRTTFRPAAEIPLDKGSDPSRGLLAGEPAQVVSPPSGRRWSLPVLDLSPLHAAARPAEALRLASREAHRGFDLTRGPLLRSTLVRLGERLHWALLTFHHIISDGWSMGVFSRELATLYTAKVSNPSAGESLESREILGVAGDLPPLPIQYPDFAVWQREHLSGAELERQVAFWRRRLTPVPEPLTLPIDRPRPPVRSGHGGKVLLTWPTPFLDRLQASSQRHGGSLFMLLLGAFKALLARVTGTVDLTLGTYIASRNRKEIQPLIGFFINTLALRTDLSGDPSFAELLGRVRETTLDAYAHQDLPFEKLLDVLDVPRDQSRTPLFQVHCVLMNMPLESASLPELTLSPVTPHRDHADYDLTLWMGEGPGGLDINFEYATDLFDRTTVQRMLGQLRLLLETVLEAPAARLRDLPLLTASARHQVALELPLPTAEWAADQLPADLAPMTGRAAPPPLVQQAFSEQARRAPDAVAFAAPGGRLSYGELLRRASRLAHALAGFGPGIGPGAVVALPAGRSPEHLISLLGILGAGAAYLPLDPTHPEERHAAILRDARPALLLDLAPAAAPAAAPADSSVTSPMAPPRAGLRQVAEASGVPVAELSAFLEAEGSQPSEPERRPLTTWPAIPLQREHRACILYTSGSTGVPKGVEVTHRSLADYAAVAADRFRIRAADRVLCFAALTFDTSLEEIYPALARGAALVARDEALPPPTPFARMLGEQAVTVLDLPTAYWHAMMAASSEPLSLPASLRLVILGGEAAVPEAVAAWRQHGPAEVELINTYGPTEGTVVASTETLSGPGSRRGLGVSSEVTIGRPRAGAGVWVFDPELRPSPLGVPGQAALGGTCLARGYLRRPAATAVAFVPDPGSIPPAAGGEAPSSLAGGRLYLTGDRVRWRFDGRLDFLGRVDQQVKVRGVRVELGEIEAALLAHPAIAEAVVLARRRDGEATITLMAYLVLRRAVESVGELRSFLATRLPDAMIPAGFTPVETLPLTAHGKVDRRALARLRAESLGGDPSSAAASRPLGNDAERQLAAIWSEVLGVSRVGKDDNFFELGGDSLRLLAVHEKIREGFGVEISVLDLFRYPTVGGLAGRLGGEVASTREAVRDVREKVAVQQEKAARRRERLRGRGGPGSGPGPRSGPRSRPRAGPRTGPRNGPRSGGESS